MANGDTSADGDEQEHAGESKFLFNRLTPEGKSDGPLWALKSSVYWMRALAIIVEDRDFSRTELNDFYQPVERRRPDSGGLTNDAVDDKAFGALLMAQHYQAALKAFSGSDDLDAFVISRSAIVTWYYVIYEISIAMVNAHSDAHTESHIALINTWHTSILKRSTPAAVGPFSLRLDSLVKRETDATIKTYRDSSTFKLTQAPTDYDEAWGAVCAYLNGTAKRDREEVEQRILSQSSFENFRTQAARADRDKALHKKKVNFLNQAFRYRGKANYRDSLYLSYGGEDVHIVSGQSDRETLTHYLDDLANVGAAYLQMASTFVSKRVVETSWNSFLADLDTNSRFRTHRA